jgi:hypothetical protein
MDRNEVIRLLDEKVLATEKQWGMNYIYSEWAREDRDKKIEEFDAGKVILVKKEPFVDNYGNGTGDYEREIYSDGTVKTICYGYSD